MRAFRRALREFFRPSSANEMRHQWELTLAHREAEAARAEAATLRQHLNQLREPTAVDLMASQTRIDLAATELHTIVEAGPGRWRTSIPVRPDYDSGLIISAGLTEGDRLVREVSHLRELLTEVLGHFDQPGEFDHEPCRRTPWVHEKQLTAWRIAAGPTTYARGGVIRTPAADRRTDR